MNARRIAVALLVGGAAVLGAADPAAAHGGQGAERSPAANYRTSISAVTPDAEGLEVRVREAGSRIELTNRTGKDITVSGYEGEPYLRITPNGVFENTRSPATYLNRDRRGRAAVPATADAS